MRYRPWPEKLFDHFKNVAMKSNQKLSILFWLKKSKTTKDGRAPIYARITIDGEEERISLGRKCHPDYWDVKEKTVLEPRKETKATNLKIAEVEAGLLSHFTVLKSQHEHITPLMLKNAYLGLPLFPRHALDVPQEQKMKTLLEAFDEFIKRFEKQVQKEQRSNETLKHWRTTRSKVAAFLLFRYKCTDISLNDIKPAFADKFYDYLTLEADATLSELTAKMHVKKTRQILKTCVTNDCITKNPLDGFRCSGGDNEVMPLEVTEVQSIYKKELTIDRLCQVRDVFIFQCFTGFAFQDVYGLTPSNIERIGHSGERWLIKDRGKTGVSEMVPILPIVEDIITKYANDPYCKANGRLLPVSSNARYNGYLKELAVICGIKRELNTHLARHTFADIMLNNGVPLEDVSKMLGHKNIRTTQRYCRVRKPRTSQSMTQVRTILFHKNGSLKKVS